jgi:hypothetical protein
MAEKIITLDLFINTCVLSLAPCVLSKDLVWVEFYMKNKIGNYLLRPRNSNFRFIIILNIMEISIRN